MDGDLYEILNLSPRAEPEVVVAAYRALALKYHPDKHPNRTLAEHKMAELNEAYATLSDSVRRAIYDRTRSTAPLKHSAVPPPPQYSGRWRRARLVDAKGREHEATLHALDLVRAQLRCDAKLAPKALVTLVLSLGVREAPLRLYAEVTRNQGQEYELRLGRLDEGSKARILAFLGEIT